MSLRLQRFLRGKGSSYLLVRNLMSHSVPSDTILCGPVGDADSVFVSDCSTLCWGVLTSMLAKCLQNSMISATAH